MTGQAINHEQDEFLQTIEPTPHDCMTWLDELIVDAIIPFNTRDIADFELYVDTLNL
jgi:hypothetical protein